MEARHFETLASAFRRSSASTPTTTTRTEPTKDLKMVLSPKSLAGPGYIILNGIRVMNIIGFMAVITASIVMLVKTSVDSKFFFFDAISHVLTAFTGSKSSSAFRL